MSFWPKSCRTTFNDKGENVGTGTWSRLLVSGSPNSCRTGQATLTRLPESVNLVGLAGAILFATMLVTHGGCWRSHKTPLRFPIYLRIGPAPLRTAIPPENLH